MSLALVSGYSPTNLPPPRPRESHAEKPISQLLAKSEQGADSYRSHQRNKFMGVEGDSGRVAGYVIELPELRRAPVAIVSRDVLNFLCRAL